MLSQQARWIRRAFGVGAVGGALALALAASPATAQTSNSNRQFVTGSVTSVHGTAVQVDEQAQNSEATVTLAPTTQITKRQSADASAITTGACVRVIGTGSASKGISARTVAVSSATSSGCGPGTGNGANGQGGPGGFRFGNGQRPNFRNGAGNGNGSRRFPNGGNFANFAIANGPVVSVSGDSVVVKSTTFTRPAAANTKSKSKGKSKSTKSQSTTPKATTSNVKVTLASSTSITQTVSGTATDVAVGSCVTATGTVAGAGITADRVNVSAPVNGSCSAGFGGGRFGGGGAGGGGGTGNGGQV
jgi:hypothetical protein